MSAAALRLADVSVPYVPEIDPDASVLDAALAYGRAGLHSVPVRKGSKHPGSVVGARWHEQSSRDPQQLAAWFAGTDYGIALHVGRSGLVVFDVDRPEYTPEVLRDGLAGAPFQSTRADDPERGHYLFRAPPGRVFGNGTGRLGGAWGEVRGRNGVIIAAPSVHQNAAQGARYRWERTGVIPALPEAMAALLPDARATTGERATTAEVEEFCAAHTSTLDPARRGEALALFARKRAEGSARHEAMLAGTLRAATNAARGYVSAREEFAELRLAFLDAVADARGRPVEAEYDRAVAGAVAIATREVGAVTVLPEVAAAAPGEVATGTALPDLVRRVRSALGSVFLRRELAMLPNVEPLIEHVMSRRSAVITVGPTGSGKTFLMLGMACSVATGSPWLGRKVERCPVLYVAGEGAYGLDARIRAWEEAWGAEVGDADMRVIVKPASLTAELFWIELAALAQEIGAGLVVLDTFSSLAPDADETKDAARITRRVSDLASALNATVVLVHHPGWSDATRVRGGSQLEANVDEVLVLSGGSASEVVELFVKKRKEGVAGQRIWLRRRPMFGSVVIEHANPGEAEGPLDDRIMDVLLAVGEVGMTGPQLLADLGMTEQGRSTVYAALTRLQSRHRVRKEGERRGGHRYYADP